MNTNALTTSGNAPVPDPVLRSPGDNTPHGESTRPGVLTVRGLTKTYGSGDTTVDAVRAVDLDLAAGEVLLVMGPSGSGKTTLLLMLGALLRPSAGSITVTSRDGVDVDIAAAREKELPVLRSRTFGFIFQDYALLDALTATENIAVAANLAGTTGSAARHRATQLLERVGLAHRAAARPSQMSGGEQQRVAVARALITEPQLVLADEPTGNLDAAIGDEISRTLVSYARTHTAIVIIATHSPSLAQLCDRLMVLEGGRIRG